MKLALKHVGRTVLLLLVCCTSQSAQAQSRGARLIQVVAGVSKYASASGQLNLKLAHKDASDMAAFWRRNRSPLFADIRGDALLDERATRENILAVLDQAVESARAGDWVVIFLAGHGGPDPARDRKEWCFCAHDVPIRGCELQERINKLADRQVTVLLILDACFSGMMATIETKAIVMAACRGDEASGESAVLCNGQFTQALLVALSGAEADRVGRITVRGLRAYVTRQVARHSGNRQTPVFYVPAGAPDELPLVGSVGVASRQGNGPLQLSAEQVANWLRFKGHRAEVMSKGQQQGKHVLAIIEEDGWQYEVTIYFTTDERGLWFSTPLRSADSLNVKQCQALMKKTSEMACIDVFTVDERARLCLETPNMRITSDPPFSLSDIFFQKLNRHLRTIRDSHDVWKKPGGSDVSAPLVTGHCVVCASVEFSFRNRMHSGHVKARER
ncbi:MAG TPA: caspase family protein [Gemmataceae bacterium]|nr:caspase family protein [Gemmataceae bacterium]